MRDTHDYKSKSTAQHKNVDSIGSVVSTTSTLRNDDAEDYPTVLKKDSLDGISDSQPLLDPHASNTVLSPLLIADDQKPTALEVKPTKTKTATWSELPNKSQLALLTISRLAEPLTQTSLQSYMFYQLKSFDPKQTDDQISSQAGILAAAFTAAQFLTAIPWGRAADSELFGRKRVILIGLLGTMLSAIGFGFSRTFYTAVFWRVIGGALNGNIGVMRTMITEIIKEKRFQSRAFMLLPMTFNIGVVIGRFCLPVISDVLALSETLILKVVAFALLM